MKRRDFLKRGLLAGLVGGVAMLIGRLGRAGEETPSPAVLAKRDGSGSPAPPTTPPIPVDPKPQEQWTPLPPFNEKYMKQPYYLYKPQGVYEQYVYPNPQYPNPGWVRIPITWTNTQPLYSTAAAYAPIWDQEIDPIGVNTINMVGRTHP